MLYKNNPHSNYYLGVFFQNLIEWNQMLSNGQIEWNKNYQLLQLQLQNHHLWLSSQLLGYIDIHLIASAILTEIPLWTVDKKLNEISSKLGIAY